MVKRAPEDMGMVVLSTYLSGTAIAPAGTAVVLSPPTGTNWALISAEGAACYYAVNAATADAAAPGYVPANNNGFVFPVDNFGSVAVFQVSGTVHVQYYQG